jgi:hypothetical protein
MLGGVFSGGSRTFAFFFRAFFRRKKSSNRYKARDHGAPGKPR